MLRQRWQAKKKPERKLASIRYRTHNHQVLSQIRSPLSRPGGAKVVLDFAIWFISVVLTTWNLRIKQNILLSTNGPWIKRQSCIGGFILSASSAPSLAVHQASSEKLWYRWIIASSCFEKKTASYLVRLNKFALTHYHTVPHFDAL